MAAVLIGSAARTRPMRAKIVVAAIPCPVVASSPRLGIVMMSLSLSQSSVGATPCGRPNIVVHLLRHRLVPDVVGPGALRLLADHGIGTAGQQDLHGPLIGGLVEIAGALLGLADQFGDLAHH